MAARKNNKGRWWVTFYFHFPDGRSERIRRISPIQNKRGAEEFERRLRAELLENPKCLDLRQEVPTVEKFSTEFMETYVAANNKPSEQIRKEYSFRRYILPAFGRRRLDDISYRDIEMFKANLLKHNLARKTISNILTVLGRMLRYAADMELIKSVPRINLMKSVPAQKRFLEFDEVQRLIEAAKIDLDARAAILCGVDAGMRMGEIRALQWDDIDFVRAQISIQRTDYRGHVGSPKGGRMRVVEMTNRLVAALKAIRHLRSEWVFCDKSGERWTRNEIDTKLTRARKKAGLRKFGWHELRHTFCSLLAMKGASVMAIKELAGHASIATTQGYMHLSPNCRREAINLLEQFDEKKMGIIWASKKNGTDNTTIIQQELAEAHGN